MTLTLRFVSPRLLSFLCGPTLFYLTLLSEGGMAQTPAITTLNPARNGRNAPANTNVAVSFSQPMSSGAATLGAMRVFSAQRGGQQRNGVGGSTSASGNTLTFNPITNFRPGETLFTTITPQAQSAGGSSLTRGQVYQFTTAVGGTGQGHFTAPPTDPNPAVGRSPKSVAVGDVDGDGDLDLVTANDGNSTVSVRLNDGTGRFTAPPTNPNPGVGSSPYSVVLGDVDGDGDLDVLTANLYSDNVSVRLNDGTGNFTPPSTNPDTPVGDAPASVVVGDVDGDGDLDFLTANVDNTVSVRLNDGTGRFTSPTTNPNPTVGSSPISVVLGDLDGDGDLDFLAANGNNTVSVRLNDGTGNFTPPTTNPNPNLGTGIRSMALGDVDGDGDLDVLTANYSTNNVSVRLNNGGGRFSSAPSPNPNPAVGDGPLSIALGDVDGDGDLDFLTTNANNTVSVRLNNGTGNFTPPATNPNPGVGSIPYSVVLGDVDGDGDLDMLAVNRSDNTVSVRLNQPAPLTITGLAATGNPVCGGSPLTFTATVGNVTGTYNFTLTNGTPTGTTASTATGPNFSQVLTASGNGPKSFTLTVSDGGPSATATTSVTVTGFTATASASSSTALVGSVVTLSASGGSTYQWSAPAGASLSSPATSSTISATLTTSGIKTFTVVVSQGTCSQALTVGLTATLPPDLIPILQVTPSLAYGPTTGRVVVDVFEINSTSTSGTITVHIAKSSLLSLSFDPAATRFVGKPVQNSVWSFDGISSSDAYILTTTQVIGAGGKLSVGLNSLLSPGQTKGMISVTATLVGGSGGEVIMTNNTDADQLEYFNK